MAWDVPGGGECGLKFVSLLKEKVTRDNIGVGLGSIELNQRGKR